MIKILVVFIFAIMLSACQTQETKIWRVDEKDMSVLMQGARSPLVLSANIRLIDARTPFDYTTAHLQSAIHLNWTEFADHRGPLPGKLKSDYFFMARRLARLGIAPDTKVIIVGYGKNGSAEESRLAWTLYYLGVKDVQFAEQNYFQARLTQAPLARIKVKNIWKPKVNDEIRVTSKQMKKILSNLPKNVRFLDVRHASKYAQTKKAIKLPRASVNIYWKDFLTSKGRANLSLKRKLIAAGIHPAHKVIVLSDAGIVSSAAVMSMLSMGYKGASNFDGGLEELLKLL